MLYVRTRMLRFNIDRPFRCACTVQKGLFFLPLPLCKQPWPEPEQRWHAESLPLPHGSTRFTPARTHTAAQHGTDNVGGRGGNRFYIVSPCGTYCFEQPGLFSSFCLSFYYWFTVLYSLVHSSTERFGLN